MEERGPEQEISDRVAITEENMAMSISDDDSSDIDMLPPPVNTLAALDGMHVEESAEEDYDGSNEVASDNEMSEEGENGDLVFVDDNSWLFKYPRNEILRELRGNEHAVFTEQIQPRMAHLMYLCNPVVSYSIDPLHDFFFALDFKYSSEIEIESVNIPLSVNENEGRETRVMTWTCCVDKETALPTMVTAVDLMRDHHGTLGFEDSLRPILNTFGKKRPSQSKATPADKMSKINKLVSTITKILDAFTMTYVLYYRNARTTRGPMAVHGKGFSKLYPAIQFIRTAAVSATPNSLKDRLLHDGAGLFDPGVIFLESLNHVS